LAAKLAIASVFVPLEDTMIRRPNAIDFWRGFALVTIFINHIPGIYYENFTHRNVSISDSADLFVFLAGWALRLTVGKSDGQAPIGPLICRLNGRAMTLYAAQLMIEIIAIAMLAVSARLLDNPLLLEWHNAAAVFYNPVDAHIGLAVLSHQLGYFDILPLYVVLMMIAPVIATIHRFAPNWLLPISFAVYLTALIFQINIPTWPEKGEWFFNPLCWQLVFVLGFIMARERGPGALVRRHIKVIRLISWPMVIAGALIVWFSLWPDPMRVPGPPLLFAAYKPYMTPIRLIQFLALIAVFSAFYPFIERWLPRLVAFLTMLGRNSLNVFCVGSLLSLAGQIVRFYFEGGIGIDTVMVAVGIAALGLTAWASEWRDRLAEKKP
jgi:hypothetical protein